MQAQTSELAKYTRLRYTNKYTMQNWVCKAYVMQKTWSLFLVMYVVRKIARRVITSGTSPIAQ